MLIIEACKNFLETSVSISKRLHVSDSYAHDVFDRYVKLDHLPLTDVISVDEVHLDMYNPYISYVGKYFPNAVPVVDSFHVIRWIVRIINNYIRQLLKNPAA